MKAIKVYPTKAGTLCKTVEEYNVTEAIEIIKPQIQVAIQGGLSGQQLVDKVSESVIAIVFAERETFSALLHVVKKRKAQEPEKLGFKDAIHAAIASRRPPCENRQ